MTSKQDYSKHSLPEISSFSKHLMLVIIAVFAMLTPLLNSSNNVTVKLFLYLTILSVIISFCYGLTVLTKIINLYTNPQKTSIIFYDIKPIIKTIRLQFNISILSVIALVITYGFHSIDMTQNANNTNKEIKEMSLKIKSLESAITVAKSNQIRLDLEEKRSDTTLKKIDQIIINSKTTLNSINLIASEQINLNKQCDTLAKEINMLNNEITKIKK